LKDFQVKKKISVAISLWLWYRRFGSDGKIASAWRSRRK
jgi:hypothetical protein